MAAALRHGVLNISCVGSPSQYQRFAESLEAVNKCAHICFLLSLVNGPCIHPVIDVTTLSLSVSLD